jgi:hypothetical protein
MESLREKLENFMLQVGEMEEGTNNNAMGETELPFRYLICRLLAMQLQNTSKIFSEMIEEINEMSIEEYCNIINAYIKKRLGRNIELTKDEKIIIKLTSEFYERSYDFLLDEYYSKLFEINKDLINRPDLTEEEIIFLFNLLPEYGITSPEEIIKYINDKTTTLTRHKEEK